MKKRITKLVAPVAVASMVMGMCVGCGADTKIEEAAPSDLVQETVVDETATENADLVTYEFDTFDNVHVVLDDSNIITQEPSEDPENSELISEAAAGNIIAPGRDYLYLEDDDFYYVADLYNNLVTVADKSLMSAESAESAEAADDENPGAFETDLWSISYDTDKWYGYSTDDSTIINCLVAEAGTSLIEITESDLATIDDVVAMLQEKTGKTLTAPEKLEKGGNECYITYDEDGNAKEGLYIFDFYQIYENNGKFIIVDESITHDDDDARAEALSYEFDDVVNTLTLK